MMGRAMMGRAMMGRAMMGWTMMGGAVMAENDGEMTMNNGCRVEWIQKNGWMGG